MIKVGIGGWTYEPWRGVFYPAGLPKTRELEYAAQKLTSIEVNGTFYGTLKPESFRRWADESPDGFVFSLKASRFAVNRRVLGEASESIDRFVNSGIAELGPKLGPILWQLPPFKRFDPEDIAKFVGLLPASVGGLRLRHALEVRHESFCTEAFIALLRAANVAVVFAEADKYPAIADATADFVYLRLQRSQENLAQGYSDAALDTVADWARLWQAGQEPDGVPRISGQSPAQAPRDVFIYMIAGAKVHNPAAAMALIERVKDA